jgi:hypothetical protein
MLPVHIRDRLEAEHTLVGPVRCGVPTAFGLGGIENGQRIVIAVYDWPQLWRQATQAGVERVQIDRFNVDYALRTGSPRYPTVTTGQNPPDFRCAHDGADVGVELTQFLAEDRVAANAMWSRVVRAALASRPTTFRRLEGHVVYISFAQSTVRPPTNPKDVRALLAAVARHGPPLGAAADVAAPPQQIDPGEAVLEIQPGVHMTALPLATPPNTLLFQQKGIELALAFQSTQSVSDCWEELQRLVRDHDQPAVTELVVALGAPVAYGASFPSDGFYRRLIPEAAQRPLSASHIERVFVHDWETREILVVTPGTPGAVPVADS